MSQEYKLTLFEKGDFQDAHGNYWCEGAFEDSEGNLEDHVKWVVKDPMAIKAGESYYGHMEEKESKAGNKYLRFYRDQRPEADTAQLSGPGPAVAKKEWQPRDDDAIRAQFALKTASEFLARINAGDKTWSDIQVRHTIEDWAVWFYSAVGRVKGSSESTDPKATPTHSEGKESLTQTSTTGTLISGYEKAKAAHQTLKAKLPEPKDNDLDAAERSLFETEEINLADIPF